MRIVLRRLLVGFAVMLLGFGVVSTAVISAQASAESCTVPDGEQVEIATAFLYVEYNAADEDIGVHGSFDDHGWTELCVFDPAGDLILRTAPEGQLGDLGIAGIFFESREPETADFSYDDLVATFPEGE